jgi:hypothetical protein
MIIAALVDSLKEAFSGLFCPIPAEPEKKICCHCNEPKEIADFIPDTDCCWACHELDVMKHSGVGVAKISRSGGIYIG